MISIVRIGVGLLWRGLLAAVLAGGLMLLGWPIPHAHADDAGGANRYGGCLAAQKSGDLLLLFDESSSLQATDAKAARVSAAKYLVQTLAKYADRVGADLDVAVASFADTYVLHQNWTKLTTETADSLNDQLTPEASRNTGIDTDYWLALDGARQTLASRDGGQNGADRCRAIAWFSDGKIDFTARPVTKPYAGGTDLNSPDGISETVRKATESICRPGGLADGIGEGLIDTLVLADGRRVTAAQFGDGMTEGRAGRTAPFDASLFTHAAQTDSSSLVAIDKGMVTRRGLGYRAAVIQAGEGLPAYDFAVFAPPQPISTVDNELPPSSGDLVF